MARCWCLCHVYPGVYPPPCGVCGHDDREGRMVGSHRDGWEPNEPKRMTRQEWQTLKVQDFERMEAALRQIMWLADASEPLSVQAAEIARKALGED